MELKLSLEIPQEYTNSNNLYSLNLLEFFQQSLDFFFILNRVSKINNLYLHSLLDDFDWYDLSNYITFVSIFCNNIYILFYTINYTTFVFVLHIIFYTLTIFIFYI